MLSLPTIFWRLFNLHTYIATYARCIYIYIAYPHICIYTYIIRDNEIDLNFFLSNNNKTKKIEKTKKEKKILDYFPLGERSRRGIKAKKVYSFRELY